MGSPSSLCSSFVLLRTSSQSAAPAESSSFFVFAVSASPSARSALDHGLRSYGYAEQPARPEVNANVMQDSDTWSALPSRGASQKRKSVRQRRRPSVVLFVAPAIDSDPIGQ